MNRKGTQVNLRTEAFTDNRGNDFILKKGMSTKYPLALLVIEACELMRNRDGMATLTWIRRDENQHADDLTNNELGNFSDEKRRRPWDDGSKWLVLDELEEDSRSLYIEIQERKEKQASAKRNGGVSKKGKKRKFFTRWSS